MNKVELCLWAVNTIAEEPENPREDTIQKLKENFDIIFADDAYFQKYRPSLYYMQQHYYMQEFFRLLEKMELPEEQILEYHSQLPGKWYRRDLGCAMIKQLCEAGKVEEAKKYIPLLSESDCEYQGYRILLAYYAEQGDLKNFQAIVKDAKPRESPMNDVEGSKQVMIKTYSEEHGFENALELCKKKIFGDKYISHALLPVVQKVGYMAAKKLFEDNPVLRQAPYNTYEKVMLEAYAADKVVHEDESAFEEMFTLLDSVDKKIRWGDFKLRDSLLLDLGVCLENADEKKYKKRILRCRKAIKNNFLKGELKK